MLSNSNGLRPRGSIKGKPVNVAESSKNSPLYSDLSDDEDMLDLLESFVSQLPNRASSLETAMAEGDLAQAKVLAHQLKGAAGSYGFGPISVACKTFEDCLAEDSASEATQGALAEVVGLCARATHLPPG